MVGVAPVVLTWIVLLGWFVTHLLTKVMEDAKQRWSAEDLPVDGGRRSPLLLRVRCGGGGVRSPRKGSPDE